MSVFYTIKDNIVLIQDGKLGTGNTLNQLSPWLVPSEPLTTPSAMAKNKQESAVILRKTVITTQL